MALTMEHDGIWCDSLEDLANADPSELWICHHTRIVDGGYPGEGTIVDGLVITSSGSDELKYKGELTIARIAEVEAWHQNLVKRVADHKTTEMSAEDFHEIVTELAYGD